MDFTAHLADRERAMLEQLQDLIRSSGLDRYLDGPELRRQAMIRLRERYRLGARDLPTADRRAASAAAADRLTAMLEGEDPRLAPSDP